MPSVHLLLGSNLGDRRGLLERARLLIAERVGGITHSSEELQSEAWGYESSNEYLNQVLVVDTELEPFELLDATQGIEREMGRVPRRGNMYEDRPIDIDILYYDDLVINTQRLTIPHPHIADRPFTVMLLSSIQN